MAQFIDRYFLNAPLTHSMELVELANGLFVMFGRAQCTLNQGQISVDLLSKRLIGKLLDRLSKFIAALTGVVFMGLIAWRMLMLAMWVYDDGIFIQVLELAIYPVLSQPGWR